MCIWNEVFWKWVAHNLKWKSVYEQGCGQGSSETIGPTAGSIGMKRRRPMTQRWSIWRVFSLTAISCSSSVRTLTMRDMVSSDSCRVSFSCRIVLYNSCTSHSSLHTTCAHVEHSSLEILNFTLHVENRRMKKVTWSHKIRCVPRSPYSNANMVLFFCVKILIHRLRHSPHMLDHCLNIVALFFGHLCLLLLLVNWNPYSVVLLNVYRYLI